MMPKDALTSQGMDKKPLKVSWRVWYGDISNRFLGPWGCEVGSLWTKVVSWRWYQIPSY